MKNNIQGFFNILEIYKIKLKELYMHHPVLFMKEECFSVNRKTMKAKTCTIKRF